MNLLYLSVHEVQEYDDLRMFAEIPNITVMPVGRYHQKNASGLRPSLNNEFPDSWRKSWATIKGTEEQPDQRFHITSEAVKPFDAIIVNHLWEWLFGNLEAFQGKTVIWRDIGQIVDTCEDCWIAEAVKHGVKIVRYWDGYQSRPNYAGHDAIIPFGKFAGDFKRWNGQKLSVYGICQHFVNRGAACNKQIFDKVETKIPMSMHGAHNGKPHKSYEEILQDMADHRLMVYGGTRPAPYTLALMEAMFTGIPVFTMKDLGWPSAMEELLTQEQLCDTEDELVNKLEFYMSKGDETLRMISDHQRCMAMEKFSAFNVMKLWDNFFKTI